MNYSKRILGYIWFVIVMKITWILPDFQVVMKFRGLLTSICYKKCGKNLMLSSDIKLNHLNKIEIGDDVQITHGVWVSAKGGLRIGDEVMVGPYTVISTGNHTMRGHSYRFGEHIWREVVIGDGTWVGGNVTIVSGVHIGKGVCCAAGAIVTDDIPDFAIVASPKAVMVNSKHVRDE